jgi:hypothetical protein
MKYELENIFFLSSFFSIKYIVLVYLRIVASVVEPEP